MKRLILLVSVAVVIPVMLAACARDATEAESARGPQEGYALADVRSTRDGEGPSRGDEGTHRERAPDTRGPSITITRPGDGATVHGGALRVGVAIEGFELVSQRVRPPFPPPVAGQGHVHFYLDTRELPTTHSPPATGVYRSVAETAYTWTGVAPGRHSLAVQLVGKDHAPLRPQAKDRITVQVG